MTLVTHIALHDIFLLCGMDYLLIPTPKLGMLWFVLVTRLSFIVKVLIMHGNNSLPHTLQFPTVQHQTTTCYLLIVFFVFVVAQERSSLEDAADQFRRVKRGGMHYISTGLKSWTNFILLSYHKTICEYTKFVLQRGR